MPETRLHTCMLCEAVCGVELEVEGNRITGVRGDKDDPFSRGHICPKAAALGDVVEDPDRVREPLRRVGSRFVPVSWDDALDEAADRLAALQKEHGRSAVGIYLGNPTVHSYTALLTAPLFSRILGSRARFSATSVDQLPQMLAALQMFGHQLLMPVPDVDRTDFFLILGGNPLISNGSIMTAPDMAGRIDAIRRRGGAVWVVDPRRTETARRAGRHLFIRPGGDAHLLLAVLHVLFDEKLARPGRMSTLCDGLDAIEALVRRFPPERVAARTGIDADTTRELARAFAAAPRAVCYGRVGVCTQVYGGLAAWLVNVVNAVTGNLDRPGGAMLTTPAADVLGVPGSVVDQGHYNVWQSRVRGLPEFGGEIPAATLAEEIETPGEGRIRGLVTFASNPVLSTPNGARVDAALAKLDFMVSIDLYRNETTRHAHLILPTSFGPERDHYDLAFYLLSVRNVARYVPAAVEPPPGVRHDWEILADLALRLHARGGGRGDRRLIWQIRAIRRFGPRRVLDLLIRFGPYGDRILKRKGLSLRALLRSPHGVDLGPLAPRLPSALRTPGRRVQLAPRLYLEDVSRLEADLDGAAPNGHLSLISRRQLRSNNSWMHNSARLVKGKERCTLLMHPDDAARRGLDDGVRVEVRSRAGAVTVPLEVTGDMIPGVVSLPHGWGHGRDGVALEVARSRPGESVNDLTDELLVDPLSGVACLSGVPVEVESATGRRQSG